ncbi:hypothetical protein FACS1894208_10420 [Clostridia bacterium]|nr:hypothetical protein FACS1894208_10420 [Clostridia bacterium]
MTKALNELKAGEQFTYGGREWVQLAENGDGVLCLTADITERREFHNDENDDATGYNDWRTSTLRKHLNETFIGGLVANGADAEAFLPFTQDLTADDGTDDYGTAEDKIALITCDQYRKHRKLIPPIAAWWWTITPWTCGPSNSDYVRDVSTTGALSNSNACLGHGGVRPLCNLKSDISVSVTTPDENANEG